FYVHLILLFLTNLRQQPRPTLFPYTTLFRSLWTVTVEPMTDPFTGGLSITISRCGANNVPFITVGCLKTFSIPPVPGKNGTLLADRKSTRLNSSHRTISYAVFCLKKKMSQTM